MTTRRFDPNYTSSGPDPVSGEITVTGPEEIGEEVEQQGLQRYLMPVMAGVMVLMVVLMLTLSFSGGAKAFQPQTLMWPLMFVMMGATVLAARAGANSKSIPDINGERKTFLRYLTKLRERVATSAAQQIAFWSYHAPNPEDLCGAVVGKRRQWSRQPAASTSNSGEPQQQNKPADYRNDLFSVARVCTGTVPADDKLLQPEGEDGELVGPDAAPQPYLEPVQHMWMIKFLRTHALIENCPKVISVKAHPTISVGGAPERAAGLLRAMICHLAAFHGPDVLQFRVLTDNPEDPDWQWLKWLPHLHHPSALGQNGPQRWISPNNDENIKDLMGRGPHVRDSAPAGPYQVVINLDGKTTYPREGRAGVTYITLGMARSEYQLSVDSEGDLHHVSRAPGAKPVWELLGSADNMSVQTATTFARRLAGWSITGEQLPTTKAVVEKADTSWRAMIGVNDIREITPARWHPYADSDRDRLRFKLGHVRPTGELLSLDIKEGAEFGMGPHGIMIGTTGSGKSETLATLLLSAMADHHPDQLNLILCDFKGGVSFVGMENEPHVVAIITNLEKERDLVARFKVTLRGEIHRREEILREANEQVGDEFNIVNFTDYEKAREAGYDLPPVPALFICVDEFAELMVHHPEFNEIFDMVVSVGRALRMHLLLATQTIQKIATQWQKLKGNMNYQICLRTQSAHESTEVIGTREAYYLPPKGDEGAGYLKVGGDAPIYFKAAYTGGVDSGPAPKPDPGAESADPTSPKKPSEPKKRMVSIFTATSSRTAA